MLPSWYHFQSHDAVSEYADATLEDFFEATLAGRIPYDNYFDHVAEHLKNRSKQNTLVTTYEVPPAFRLKIQELWFEPLESIQHTAKFILGYVPSDDTIASVIHDTNVNVMRKDKHMFAGDSL